MKFIDVIDLNEKDLPGINYMFRLLKEKFNCNYEELRENIRTTKEGTYYFVVDVNRDTFKYNPEKGILTKIETIYEYDFGEYIPELRITKYRVIIDIKNKLWLFLDNTLEDI